MDKLLNIDRLGGYPMCAENVQILYDNAFMLNAVMSKLGLPAKTAIWLRNNVFVPGSAVNHGFNYLFVSNGQCGELLKVGNGENNLLNYAKVRLTVSSVLQDVTDEHNETYTSVYQIRTVDVDPPVGLIDIDAYSILQLDEVIESAYCKRSSLPYQAQMDNSALTAAQMTLLDEPNDGLRLYKNKLTLRLTYQLGSIGFSGRNSILKITMSGSALSSNYPLRVCIYDNHSQSYYHCDAMLSSEDSHPVINIEMKKFFDENTDSPVNIQTGGYLWINEVFVL